MSELDNDQLESALDFVCEAHDELRIENAALKNMLAIEKGMSDHLTLVGENLLAECETLKQERDRYKVALEKIAEMERHTFAECEDAEFIIVTAKEALKISPSTDTSGGHGIAGMYETYTHVAEDGPGDWRSNRRRPRFSEHNDRSGDGTGGAVGWLCVKSPIPHCKAFRQEVADGHLTVFVGQEPTYFPGEPVMSPSWHLSISHRSSTLLTAEGYPLPGRLPSWDEIKEARYKFMPDDINVAMMLPPMSEYVNCHPTTMHLWEVPMKYCQHGDRP